MGNSIRINNQTLFGNSIVVNNGVVYVDGKRVEVPENEKTINITAESIQSLRADNCHDITVKGDAGNIDVSQGSVTVNGSVKGNIEVSQGNVNCGNVGGDIEVSMGNVMSRR